MKKCVLAALGLAILSFSSLSFAGNAKQEGVYLLMTEIEGKTYQDLLVITKGASSESGGYGPIEGSLTVPGVFTAILEKAEVSFCWSDACSVLKFVITAKEEGKTFQVRYHAFLPNSEFQKFSGNAILVSSGKLMGKFKAQKLEIK